MIPYQRRLQMLQLLENKEVVFLSDFCQTLDGVSESTVRRDLKTLEREGQITLLRGGGACLKQGSYEMPVNSKGIKNVSEKEQIARYAAELVKDGESIYLDSGSTAYRMIPHLKDKDINVITTNALIFSDIQDMKMKCFIVGGEINFSTGSIFGVTTIKELSEMYFDKAFLGVNGISERAGISTPTVQEAEKKRIVKQNSTETYVLADHSKIGKNALCKVFELGEVPIICDQESEILINGGNYIIAE